MHVLKSPTPADVDEAVPLPAGGATFEPDTRRLERFGSPGVLSAPYATPLSSPPLTADEATARWTNDSPIFDATKRRRLEAVRSFAALSDATTDHAARAPSSPAAVDEGGAPQTSGRPNVPPGAERSDARANRKLAAMLTLAIVGGGAVAAALGYWLNWFR